MRSEGPRQLVESFFAGATEQIFKREVSVFCLEKDMFDAVVVTVFFVAELKAVAATHRLERCRAIGQKHGVIDGVFRAKLADERVGNLCRFRSAQALCGVIRWSGD